VTGCVGDALWALLVSGRWPWSRGLYGTNHRPLSFTTSCQLCWLRHWSRHVLSHLPARFVCLFVCFCVAATWSLSSVGLLLRVISCARKKLHV